MIIYKPTVGDTATLDVFPLRDKKIGLDQTMAQTSFSISPWLMSSGPMRLPGGGDDAHREMWLQLVEQSVARTIWYPCSTISFLSYSPISFFSCSLVSFLVLPRRDTLGGPPNDCSACNRDINENAATQSH
jgi:hypothetical protein